MKKFTFSLALCLSLLAGCTPTPEPSAAETPPVSVCATDTPSLAQDEVPDWVSCLIVDGAEEGELLLAELEYPLNDRERNRHDGKSVYRLSAKGIAVYLDGEPAQPSDLRDGMSVEVSFNGTVLETFPAQLGEAYELHAWSIGTPQSPGGGYFDLCGLYLQVLDDLWNTDPGLNSGISMAGLDLSRSPVNLLDSETSALCWRFGELHGVEVIQGTFEDLLEDGYLTAVGTETTLAVCPPQGAVPVQNTLYQWEDGCLFSIKENLDHTSEVYFGLPVLFFDAQKWRSPLGAYYFGDCSAVWPESGTWSGYTIGSQAIS